MKTRAQAEPFQLDSVTISDVEDEGPREPAATVAMTSAMRRYECNQQGCCCGGWRIPFKPRDLVRLRTHLGAAGRDKLERDVELRMELLDDGSQRVREAYLVDDKGDCRFLDADHKRCEVHATAGVEPLPDICVDFPVASYASPAGADFYFDPVCPAVLDRIVDDDGPVRIELVDTAREDASFRRRATHLKGTPVVRAGARELRLEGLDVVRRKVLASLEDASRPVWQHLHAIDAAYAELARGECDPASFSLRYDRDPAPYMRFFNDCLAAHGPGTLERIWLKYRRFTFAIPRDGPGFDELGTHLRDWRPAFGRWLADEEDALRPVHLRYLAHRHFAPFLTIDGELRFAAGAIAHAFATSLRYAAAFGAVLRRPVDRDVTKVSLGCAEYVYRWLEIPPDSLPWFGAEF